MKSLNVFEGLNKKEIVGLYNDVPINNLQPGRGFRGKGNNRDTIYVVLTGEIKVIDVTHDMHNEVAAVLSQGCCFRQTLRSISLIANVESSVMVINKRTFSGLSEKVQVFLLRRLNDFYLDYLDNLTQKNKQLQNDIFRVQDSGGTDYGNSELIVSILKKIPRLPASSTTLAAKLADDNVSLEEVSKTVTEDPSLSGMVLKTINSSYYSFEKKISDISQAIVYLGFNAIFQMIMAENVRKISASNPYFQDLYLHSVAISHIAFEISEACQTERPAQISTICLLHDFGKNVIILLKEKNPKLNVLIDTMDSDQMGSLLLRKWNLPDIVWQSTQFQSYPQFSPPDNIPSRVRNCVTILYFSHLCYGIFQGQSEEDLPITFLPEYKQLLNWKNLSLDHIIHDILLKKICKKMNYYPKSFQDFMEKYLLSRQDTDGD